MQVVTSKEFDRQFRHLSENAQKKFAERIKLFFEDTRDPRLNIHKLSGKYEGLWSFNVTGDIRTIFDSNQKGIVVLVTIGTHSQLYK